MLISRILSKHGTQQTRFSSSYHVLSRKMISISGAMANLWSGYRLNKPCHVTVALRMTWGIIGSLNFTFGTIACLLWLTYLLGGYFISIKRAIIRESNHQQNTEAKTSWPLCPLKESTKLFILFTVLNDLIGSFTIDLRLTYLAFTGSDPRLLVNEAWCRTQIFLAQVSMDGSIWMTAVLYAERLYITLRPTVHHSRSPSHIGAAVTIILVVHLGNFLMNILILLPQEKVCLGPYDNYIYYMTRSILSQIIPFSIIIISAVGVLWKLLGLRRRNRQAVNQQSTDTDDAIIASTTMLFNGLLLMFLSVTRLIHFILNPAYCCLFTILAICDGSDYWYISWLLLLWMWICVKSYTLLFSSARMRADIGLMMKRLFGCLFVWFECKRTLPTQE